MDELEKIKNTYSVEEMNTILNMYSRQLDIYMVINRIMNAEELSNIDLINIINDNLNYNTYNSLNIPFTLLQLKYKILKVGISEEKPKMFSNLLTSLPNIIPKLPNIMPKLPNIPKFSPFNRGKVDQRNVEQRDVAQGAGSLKVKKNKKHSNTMKNKNRNRNNKNTIKRNNKKMKRHTRKN